jgi:hypothetical protein
MKNARLLLILSVCLLSCVSESPKEKKELISKEAWADVERAVNLSLKEGLIKRLDIQTDRAWINDISWSLCNAEVKENIARTLATYCAIKKNQEYRSIEIMDWQSGKKMASFSSLGGFKVY